MSTSAPTWKRFDTYPPLVGVLLTAGAPADISSATAVKIILKGATALVTGPCTKLAVVTPTGNTTNGSPTVAVISSMTSIVVGSSAQGPGIPVGARVGSISGSTVNLVDANWNPVNATATATGVALTFNVGTVQYNWAANDTSVADTYQQEFEVTLPGGPPTQVVTFPNSGYNTVIVTQDLENA